MERGPTRAQTITIILAIKTILKRTVPGAVFAGVIFTQTARGVWSCLAPTIEWAAGRWSHAVVTVFKHTLASFFGAWVWQIQTTILFALAAFFAPGIDGRMNTKNQ